MGKDLDVDSTEYLELERERRELAEVLFAKGVITATAIERERTMPQVMTAEKTTEETTPAQSHS